MPDMTDDVMLAEIRKAGYSVNFGSKLVPGVRIFDEDGEVLGEGLTLALAYEDVISLPSKPSVRP